MFKFIALLSFILLTFQHEVPKKDPLEGFSLAAVKIRELVHRIQDNFKSVEIEDVDYELVGGYALTQVKFVDIHLLQINIDNTGLIGFFLESEKFRVELSITGGYVIPLVIEGLYVSVSLRGGEKDSKLEDFEIRYENAYVDSNIIVSTITSYVFSNTMLDKYIQQARVQMKFLIYKGIQYNSDLVIDSLQNMDKEDSLVWFNKLKNVDGVKLKGDQIVINIEDMFHFKQKQREKEQQEQKNDL